MFPLLRPAATAGLLGLCALMAPARLRAQQLERVFPVANSTVPTTARTPTPGGAAANVEHLPLAEKPDPNAPTETEILATNGADFASKERIAVFQGDVRVNDPRFQLACDKLTVFLAKTAAPDGKDTPAAGNTPPPAIGATTSRAKPEKDPDGGGIDHARADGHVIIIQKRPAAKPGEEPKISIGRGEWAEFDNKTGDMILHGMPSVEQNGNTHVALAPSTVMTLHKDNSMNTVGPSRTVIKQQHKEDAAEHPGSAPGASPKPAGKPHARATGSPQG